MTITIRITDKHASVEGAPIIVCGNSSYLIKFIFDAEWDAQATKTARFVYVQDGQTKYVDKIFTGDTVPVPVLSNTKKVLVGVYAGNLQTSTSARIPCELSIRCHTGAPADPEPSVYDQLVSRVNSHDKRITNLEERQDPGLTETDESVAYIKDVPAGVLPFAEVAQIGGMTYRDGNVLRSSPVTAVESLGTNLFKASFTDALISGPQERAIIDNNTISCVPMYGSGSDYIIFAQGYPSGTYTIGNKHSHDKARQFVKLFDQNGNNVSVNYNLGGGTAYNQYYDCFYSMGEVLNVTIPAEVAYWRYGVYCGEPDDGTAVVSEIQVARGTDVPFSPYREPISLLIPEAVQKLDGYGEGVNESVYNYIDYEKKQFVKRVGCVDLGTLDWNGGETNVFYADIDNNLTPKLEGYVGVCSLYDIVLSTASANLLNKQMVIATLMQTGQAGRTFVKNTAYTDSATFKAAMSGVMLYYELATPEATDISDILPADNYIGVEGGGVLTFANEHKAAVPSIINYALKGE